MLKSAPLLESLHLESLESGRTDDIKIVECIMFGDCHPAVKDIFSVRCDGALISSHEPRIAIEKSLRNSNARFMRTDQSEEIFHSFCKRTI